MQRADDVNDQNCCQTRRGETPEQSSGSAWEYARIRPAPNGGIPSHTEERRGDGTSSAESAALPRGRGEHSGRVLDGRKPTTNPAQR